MALSDEEKAQLDALTKKANEPEPEDFSIEIWDETGAGAKVPYSQGKSWLQRFGIGLDEPEPEAEPGKPKAVKTDDKQPPAQRYFGSKKPA